MVSWRNNADGANLDLAINGSNQLTFAGAVLATLSSGVVPIAQGGTNSSTTLNNNRVMKSLSGAIVEAAAITASRALVSDANGIPVASTLSTTNLQNVITALTGDVTATGAGGSAAATFAATANATLASLDRSGGVTVRGTNTSDSAGAGYVGEYLESLATATNLPTTNQYGDLASISLTAGDWDVSALVNFDRNTASEAQFTAAEAGISSTSGNSATGLALTKNWSKQTLSTGIGSPPLSIPKYRISLSSTTTYYLKFRGTYTANQPQAQGGLYARRVR